MRPRLGKIAFAASVILWLASCAHLTERKPGPLVETCVLKTLPGEEIYEIALGGGKSSRPSKPRAVCATKEQTTEIRTLERVHKYVCLPPGDLEALILWGTRE